MNLKESLRKVCDDLFQPMFMYRELLMKRSVLFLSIAALSGAFLSAHAFNKDHVKQLEMTNTCENCDLSSANLSKGNHSGARLDNANLSSILASDVNLSGASLRNANLSGANLDYGNLSYADLTGATLNGAFLISTNLYGAKGADLTNARICDSILPDGSASEKCSYIKR